MLPLALRFPARPELLLAAGALLRCILHPQPRLAMAALWAVSWRGGGNVAAFPQPLSLGSRGWGKQGRLACNLASTRGRSCRLLLCRWLPCLTDWPCPAMPAACRLQALLPLGRQHLGSRAVAWFGLGLAAALLLTSDVMQVGGAARQGAVIAVQAAGRVQAMAVV